MSEQNRLVNGHYLPQHCLYFFPLPHGHGSLRPTLGPVRTGLALALACASAAAAASFTTSLAFLPSAEGAGAAAGLPSALACECSVCRGVLRRKFSNAIKLDALRKTLWQIS